MPAKQNALLAKYEAAAEARARAYYDSLLASHAEIDLITHMVSASEDLGVGPHNAESVLNGFLETKLEVAEEIVRESSDDEQGEFCKTQRDLAKLLKDIFGARLWHKYKHYFPMLRTYWDLV